MLLIISKFNGIICHAYLRFRLHRFQQVF